ncbi:MAG TPA: S9 family peptidase [Candidatus Krumholzibacteria bacterium]|nr:S9 family peptidase [Candidatus Krumholzibacteria bacterium]
MGRGGSRGLGVDDWAHLRAPEGPVMAPDGKRIAYAVPRTDWRRNRTCRALALVLVPTKRIVALTDGTHDDREPCWTPASDAVVFVSDRDGRANLWILRLGSAAPEQLTHLDGDLRAPKVSPDGKYVAFLHSARPKTASSGPEFEHWRANGATSSAQGMPLQLCMFELRTRRVRRLTRGSMQAGAPAWSPDSRALAFVAFPGARHEPTANGALHVVSLRGGVPRLLTRAPGPKFAPAWSPDGETIAYLGHKDTAEPMHVWSVAARGGRPQDLIAGSDLMCTNVCVSDALGDTRAAAPIWSVDGRRVLFLASQDASVNVFEVAATGGTPAARTRGRHEIAAFSRSASGRAWALLRLDPTHPGDLYVAGLGSGRSTVTLADARRLTRFHAAALRGKAPVRPQPFVFATAPGHRIHGFVLHARGKARRGPAVIALYTGPRAMLGWSFVHELQLLAAAGYHVICPNLRGSAGFGTPYLRAISGKWGFEDLNDLHALADWVESRPFVDGGRVALVGRDHGGFLTLWALGHTRRFKCAVATSAAANFLSLHGTGVAGRALTAEFLAPPWESHERYWRTSPLAYSEHMRAPLLLLHGMQDRRCPMSQSEEMFSALAVLGRDVELVRFAGESESFERSGRPHNRSERLRHLLDWLERKL